MPTRKHPAHHSPIGSPDRPTVIMITTCVTGRRLLLARPEIHDLLCRVWHKADHWQVNRYVVMPDHVHLFCCPCRAETSLARWRSYWRSEATRQWPYDFEKPIWQKDDWDTQIRSGLEFTEKWHYVRNNPVRQGLVSHPDEWPYQGEIFPFVWMER